jgi:hypothetical protein
MLALLPVLSRIVASQGIDAVIARARMSVCSVSVCV